MTVLDNSKGKLDNSSGPESDVGLKRREVLKKYGAYTAPLVVSMLTPSQAYAMNNGVVYSSTAICRANHTGMQTTNMHCEPGHMSGHVM